LQTIIEGFTNINEITNTSIATKLSELGLNVTTDFIADNDLFQIFHKIGTGQMRTSYARKLFYKEHFSYIDPICIYLGPQQDHKASKIYYVPILETIKMLMKNPHVYRQWRNNNNQNLNQPNVFEDITDGQVSQNNPFFKDNSGAFRIILYQDAFEICNPLGSSKKIHKLVGIYMVLGNISSFNRSRVDHIQLVTLCLESDVKKYGFKQICEILIRDIRTLEDGMNFNNGTERVRGSVVAVIGDNLGSHQIGGYVENFSKNPYFCRYCHITKAEFESDIKLRNDSLRTKNSYQLDVDLCDMTPGESSRGITCDSAKKIINKYPKQFQGIDEDGVIIGDGCFSLTSKLIDRNNYLNRPHKRPSNAIHIEVPPSKRKLMLNAKAGVLIFTMYNYNKLYICILYFRMCQLATAS
jgi:hypothetical protein